MQTEDKDYDENCDPNHPRKIKYDDILAAARRLAGLVVRTACKKAHMSEKLGMEIYLKHEFMQFTGSFKERGARNALCCLTEEQKKYGVVTATDGNHGLAMSYHCSQLSLPCVVVITSTASINTVRKCEMLGAKVIQYGANHSEAKRHALSIAKEKKMTYINGYDHPNVIEGHGSIGIEIIEQVPSVDAILIAVGGGALLSGVAIAVKNLKPNVEIYGIETEKTCSMVESLRKNEHIHLEIESTIANALAVNKVGVNTFYNIKGLIDKMIVVKEDWVARAILHLSEDERFVVEGAGAVPVAAIMAGLFPNLKGKKVVCIIGGGNIDPSILARSVERGMAAEGRLVVFKVTISDRPGCMAELCSLISNTGALIRDCVPERAWVKGDVFSMQINVVAETRGWEHVKELIEQIKKNYKEYFLPEMGAITEKPANIRRGPCLAPNPVCMQK